VNRPNLYKHATSELSQDATLAYILSWAHPDYRESNTTLNKLGERLLRALVASAAKGIGKPDPLVGVCIEKLEVRTQDKRIDITAEINNQILLIIEDKIYSHEGADQIVRYVKAAEKRKGKEWQILPVYVKTGNECQPFDEPTHGRFMRRELLAVIDDNAPDTGNTIIEDFRHYLRDWQTDTESYLVKPWWDWSRSAHEGYYMELERWIREELEPSDSLSWGKVNNEAGGFLGCWWYGRPFQPEDCNLYLQIEPSTNTKPQDRRTRLHIRADSAKADDGTAIKTQKSLLYAVLGAVKEVASQKRFAQHMRVEKAGRYRSGWSANVADLFFDRQENNYMAVSDDGILDFPATKHRLRLAMDLLDAVSSTSTYGSI